MDNDYFKYLKELLGVEVKDCHTFDKHATRKFLKIYFRGMRQSLFEENGKEKSSMYGFSCATKTFGEKINVDVTGIDLVSKEFAVTKLSINSNPNEARPLNKIFYIIGRTYPGNFDTTIFEFSKNFEGALIFDENTGSDKNTFMIQNGRIFKNEIEINDICRDFTSFSNKLNAIKEIEKYSREEKFVNMSGKSLFANELISKIKYSYEKRDTEQLL